VERRDDQILFVAEDEDDHEAAAANAGAAHGGEGGDAVGEFTLGSGETVDFILEIALPDGRERLGRTRLRRQRLPRHVAIFGGAGSEHSQYQGRWREMVSRSALTLKLLTSEPYGSIAAAGTFGLPEQVGGPTQTGTTGTRGSGMARSQSPR